MNTKETSSMKKEDILAKLAAGEIATDEVLQMTFVNSSGYMMLS